MLQREAAPQPLASLAVYFYRSTQVDPFELTRLNSGERFAVAIRESRVVNIPRVLDCSWEDVLLFWPQLRETQGCATAIDEKGPAHRGAIQRSLFLDASRLQGDEGLRQIGGDAFFKSCRPLLAGEPLSYAGR